ncbi:MAG: hypothetical protein HQL42_02215 [Alphaproteobacteria bacterium]|nr:hypothetical protein [Alphaproteobacteria bacterium]
MSISASAQAPIYSDPDRLVPFLASERADTARAAAVERDAKTAGKDLSMFAEEEPSFWDVLDVINPLQHIPVINTLYQELTGDKIGVGARLAGGALFGGPLGLIASAAGCVIEQETGNTVGGHVLAMFKDDAPATAIAQAKPEEASAPMQVAAAPVVTLPEPVAGQAATPQVMFTADGMVAPPSAAPAPQAAVQKVALAQPAAPLTDAKPFTPIGQQPSRFMPIPNRMSAVNPPPLQPISVPVSNSGSRSNVPITGRDPVSANNASNAMAVQKIMADQGLGGQAHPMLPGSGKMAVPPTGMPAPPADWVQSMNKALDKYERAGSLATRPQPTTTLDLQ